MCVCVCVCVVLNVFKVNQTNLVKPNKNSAYIVYERACGHVHMCVCVCGCACVCVRAHVCSHACILACMQAFGYACMCGE